MDNNILQKRKPTRLKKYDYSAEGLYFITVCTKDKKCILSHIKVGTGVLDRPENVLTDVGKIADKYINQLNNFYKHITVDKYIIMPNHIHLLLQINVSYGRSGTPVPTDIANSTVSKFISTLKRFCNKEYDENLWQRSFYDHIVRGEADYLKIWQYIDSNAEKWADDCYYTN